MDFIRKGKRLEPTRSIWCATASLAVLPQIFQGCREGADRILVDELIRLTESVFDICRVPQDGSL